MKRISPLQVKWTVLEELSTSESLNKEGETTTELGEKSHERSRKVLQAYYFMNNL